MKWYGPWDTMFSLVPLHDVSTNLEILFREQGGYREHCEYTYDGGRKIDIAFKLVIESHANAIV